MQIRVRGLFPGLLLAQKSVDGTQRSYGQQELVRIVEDHHLERKTERQFLTIDAGKLTDADQAGDHLEDQEPNRDEGHQRHRDRHLLRRSDEDANRQVEEHGRLEQRIQQDVKRHDLLLERGQTQPPELEENLVEALHPAGTLLDEAIDGIGRFFLGGVFSLIHDLNFGSLFGQAEADVGVFGQAGLIPAADALHPVPLEEDGVTAQRGDVEGAGKGVQARLEPEEVFQHIERREPGRFEVHQLHARLHHVGLVTHHHGVDHVVDFGVRLVFGVENAHDVVVGGLEALVEAVGLVARAIGEGDSMLAGMTLALIRGEPLQDALRMGVAAGAAKATTLGQSNITRDEVDRLRRDTVAQAVTLQER